MKHIFRKLKALVKKLINKIRATEEEIKLVFKPIVDGVRVYLGVNANERPYKEDSMKVLHRIRVPTFG